MKTIPEISFPDLEAAISNEKSYLFLGESIEKAFPRLGDERAGVGSQFAEPWRTIQAAVRWMWLNFLGDSKSEHTSAVMEEVIRRSIQATKRSAGNYFRPDHDVFLLVASILLGKKSLIEEVSDTVLVADPTKSNYQFCQAWAGVLVARLTGQADEREQLEVLTRKKGLAAIHGPTHALARAFCAKDHDKLSSLISSTYKAEWVAGEKDGRIEPIAPGLVNVYLRGRDPNGFWPWSEAVFAKLAILDGAKPIQHPLWLPKGLLCWSD